MTRRYAGFSAVLAITACMVSTNVALAQKVYDAGASDSEIKIGQTMPYSGPASAYGTVGQVMSAYFDKVNSEGGINGRKIVLLSRDDGYSPPKTVEAIRKLVEGDEVLLVAGALGTAPNAAVQKYLNGKRVPQLFVASGATRWGDPQAFPWTMGWQPSYQAEGGVLGRYAVTANPAGKIALFFQNDDAGKDYAKGFKVGLGAASSQVVSEASYEVTEPTIDARIVSLQSSGANVIFIHANPKFTAQAIRKIHELNWRPTILLASVSSSVGGALQPAGLENSIGAVTAAYLKDPTDATWAADPGVMEWLSFMKQWYPRGNVLDLSNTYGYSLARTVVQVLARCGDRLTRENVMHQAANLRDVELPLLLPGIRLNTSGTDYFPIKQMRLARFDGKSWVLMSEAVSAP